MRGYKPLFLILILLATVLQPVLAIDEVVDDYVDTSLVSYQSADIIHNSTLDCMELAYRGAVYENLSIYTEVDGDGDLTVIDISVTWDSLRRDAESWLVYDFGVGYFNDIQLNFTVDFSDIEAGDDSGRDILAMAMFSNSIGTYADLIGGDLLVIFPRQRGLIDDTYTHAMRQISGGVSGLYEVGVAIYFMAPIYMTLERVGTTVTMRAYSDFERTILLETLTDVGVNDGYRYLHVLASYDSPTGDPADYSSGVLSNVTLPGMGYGTGWFNTTDLLAGVGYNATALLTNSSIITGSINVEVLEGGSWTDLGDIANGYDALDLRDNLTSSIFRLNYTGSYDPLRLYQLRLVHEDPGAGPVVTVSTAPYLAMAIILLMLGLVLGMRMRR